MAGEKVMSGNLRLTLGGKTVYHATDASLSLSRSFTERTTKDTDGTQRAKGTKSWTASTNALAVYGGDGTDTNDFFAIFDMYDDDSDTPIAVEFVPDEADGEYMLSGTGFIETLDKNAPVDEDATISVSIIGNGKMNKIAIPVTP